MRKDLFVLRVDRPDGSRTYKGPWSSAHCGREEKAWNDSLPNHRTEIVSYPEARADFLAWSKAIRDQRKAFNNSPRYFPVKEGP